MSKSTTRPKLSFMQMVNQVWPFRTQPLPRYHPNPVTPNPARKPKPGKVSPAVYRQRHMGRKQVK